MTKTWTLTVVDKKNLQNFKRKVLQRISGQVREGKEWGTRNNTELQSLIGKDTVKLLIHKGSERQDMYTEWDNNAEVILTKDLV